MIINANHRGQTRGGRYAYRPLLQPEPNDFPPESKYWRLRFDGAHDELIGMIGEQWIELADLIWPGDTIKDYSWRELALQVESVIDDYNRGVRDLRKLTAAAWEEENVCTCNGVTALCRVCHDYLEKAEIPY